MRRVVFPGQRHIITVAAVLCCAWSVGSGATFSWQGPRVEINDATTTPVEILIEVSGLAGTISDLNFSIDGAGAPSNVLGDTNAGLDHESLSDLVMTLTSPTNKTVSILNHAGTRENDRNFFYTVFDDEAPVRLGPDGAGAPFTSRYIPAQALSGFDTLNPNGTWRVRVSDTVTSDTGGISAVSLHIETSGEQITPAPVAFPATPPRDITSGYSRGAIMLRGGVIEYANPVASVRVRRVTEGANPDEVQWQSASLSNGTWSFNSNLDLGANKFQIQAIDSEGNAGTIITRLIVRDQPVFNGPKPDFAYLNEFTGIQVAKTRDNGVLPLALWNSATGYTHDALTGWRAMTADVNGDGLDDLATVTPFGDLWISINNGSSFVDSFKSASGFVFDEYEGWGVFEGDFNGDGFDDFLQFAPGGHLYVGWSNGTSVAGPAYISTSGFTYLPNEHHWIGVADMNGDSRDDVVYVANNGDVWIALSTNGNSIAAPTKWAATGFFRHNRGTLADPLAASEVFLGDFDGDGRFDLGYIDSLNNTWVTRSTGSALSAVEHWGNQGLIYAPYLGFGWNMFVADINADAMMDILQIDQFGQVRAAQSSGNSFMPPQGLLTDQRMYHNILGPRRIFLREFGE